VSCWSVDADTLVRSTFVVSPLAEAIATLRSLACSGADRPPGEAWLGGALAAYRARLQDDPVTAQLVTAVFGRTWIADFFTPTPRVDPASSVADELAVLRGSSPATAVADLELSLGGGVPEELRRDDLPRRAADLLAWVWTEVVAPDWDRRRRVLEADVSGRGDSVSRGGWEAALGFLRPTMRWLGDGRLQIDTGQGPTRNLAGERLMFTPVTAGRGWVSWDGSGRSAIVYSCRGVLARPSAAPPPRALQALLGPARAQILLLAGDPISTTQLVAISGQVLGAVGRHVKVLRDAGLLSRARAGRSVLYQRTPAGDTLVEGSGA
jgi:hypothetical protein